MHIFTATKKVIKTIKKVIYPNNLTELVFILDRSGSMANMAADTIGGFNSMIDRQKKREGECFVSTFLFSDEPSILHDRLKLGDVPRLTDEDYCTYGCTALLDTIGCAIDHIRNIHKYARQEDVPCHTLFCITTDGIENASREYGISDIKNMIESQKSIGWEFIFIGANIDAVSVAGELGIGNDRSATYTADKLGTESIYNAIDEVVSYYRAAKHIGNDWKCKIR